MAEKKIVQHGATDWKAVQGVTDDAIEAAIAADPDATHPTDGELERMRAGWGGRRTGAGRPVGRVRADRKVQVSVRLAPDVAAWLKGQRHQGRIIEEALRQAHKLPS